MKQVYNKPEVSILLLRPEERLATCDYGVTQFSTKVDCEDFTWIQIPFLKNSCEKTYTGSGISGS